MKSNCVSSASRVANSLTSVHLFKSYCLAIYVIGLCNWSNSALQNCGSNMTVLNVLL